MPRKKSWDPSASKCAGCAKRRKQGKSLCSDCPYEPYEVSEAIRVSEIYEVQERNRCKRSDGSLRTMPALPREQGPDLDQQDSNGKSVWHASRRVSDTYLRECALTRDGVDEV